MIDMTGKTVLVTGGSRGIGAATVPVLLGLGADVVVHYGRSREAAQALERKLKGSAAAITSRANTTTRVRPVALASRGSLGCSSWICWDGAGIGAGLGLLNTKKPCQGQGWIALWR